MSDQKIACGIDFGTSNSVVSIVRPGADGVPHIDIVPFEHGADTIPTALFYPADQAMPQFGQRAVSSYQSREEGRFMRSMKRALGTSLMSEGTMIGMKRVSFSDIIATFLKHVKDRAEEFANLTIDNVVMGRPVHFVDGDAAANAAAQNQLEACARQAGFKNIQFQYEPIAAAFAHEANLPDDREYMGLVIDIGGGTSDFSVIRLSRQYQEKFDRTQDVLANTGVRIGGNDFDRRLSLAGFMPLLGMGSMMREKGLTFPKGPFFDLSEWSRIPFMYTPKYKRDLETLCKEAADDQKVSRLMDVVTHEWGHTLLGCVEESKIALSQKMDCQADLSWIETGLICSLTRQIFDISVHDDVARIQDQLDECLHQAGIRPENIDLVIMTGGGTALPIIQDQVKAAYPHAMLSRANMMASVGMGLGYDAGRHYNDGPN